MLVILHEWCGDFIYYYYKYLSKRFFPNMPFISNALPNLIGFLNALGDAGIVGLITLVVYGGSFYLAYNLYNFFKKHHDKYQPL